MLARPQGAEPESLAMPFKVLFAGVSLDGATLQPDDDANKNMYGRKMANRDVVLGTVKAPSNAARLIAELDKHSSRRAGG